MSTRRMPGWLGRMVGAAAVALGIVSAAAFASSASAATPGGSLTFSTNIQNRPDNGHGTPARWAYDNFTRQLTISVADPSSCPGMPATGDTCFFAAIRDNGTFDAILGAGAPAGRGGQITHAVTGNLNGAYGVAAYAPDTDTLTGTVPATEDDNFADPTGVHTTTNWLTQAFATPGDVVLDGTPLYSWSYGDTCELWTDASTNNDGQDASAGNITGLTFCAVATSNVVQVKNRATGKCLNEDKNTGLLSTYTCLPGTYVSLRWQVVTYSDGTRDLVSVQTGQSVRDGAVNQQLSLTSTASPMRFQNGGIFRFADNLVMGVNNQGNFVPVIGSPSYSSLNNVRWDFGSVPA